MADSIVRQDRVDPRWQGNKAQHLR